jgi:hypothetical protein
MRQVRSMELLRKMLQDFRRETCVEERDDSEGVVVDEVQINVDPQQAGNFFSNWATSCLMKDSAPCG